jgi:hypothetical protein
MCFNRPVIAAAFAGLLFLFCPDSPVRAQGRNDIAYAEPFAFNPPSYVCYKAPAAICIDGVLSPEEWDLIPWTCDFTDIEGDRRPAPYLRTRAKMTYDEEGFYVAALLEEPHIWAAQTEHDAVIFRDNDFEVFIDPSNDTHNYLEYEINAMGTDWDLYLTKPYRDEGCLYLNGFELKGMKAAVHVYGTLNHAADRDSAWSVEVFIPWITIGQVARGNKPGDHLRVNFSRVEWETEVQEGRYVKKPFAGEERIREHNWVWAPTGVISIHMPEYWGYVQISGKTAGSGEESFVQPEDEGLRQILRQLYYRQRQYLRRFGEYAPSLSDLKAEEVCPAEIMARLSMARTMSMYEITLTSPGGEVRHIRHDGLIWKTGTRKAKAPPVHAD